VLDDELRIACGDGVFRITELQRAGGKALDARAFLRGFPLAPGTLLGPPCPASN
jgi:methionyl-tRNA formyltransferase